jgi:glycosyltransferase involved in cell wall biosynthesis
MESAAIRQSAGVVAVCEALETRARRVAPDHLIQRLEDVSLLTPGPRGLVIREELRTSDPIVMYVGNLESYQGIDLLLESFALALSHGAAAHLVIIGGAAKHILKYRERAAALNVTPRVHLLGPRPLEELHWNLQQADILVSPRTVGSNTPMKIYSYLDSGRPLLATRLATHTQVLDEEVAVLADPTPAAMAAGLQRLIADDELRASLAEQARERVAAEFSAEAFERKLAGFYAELERRFETDLPAEKTR